MPLCCRIGADEASRLPAPDIVNPGKLSRLLFVYYE
jgi:hypothetical protein